MNTWPSLLTAKLQLVFGIILGVNRAEVIESKFRNNVRRLTMLLSHTRLDAYDTVTTGGLAKKDELALSNEPPTEVAPAEPAGIAV
jgi:hypothetical protein